MTPSKPSSLHAICLATTLLCAGSGAWAATPAGPDSFRREVDEIVLPLMAAHDIPGMSVAVALGANAHVFHYGVAAQGQDKAVNDQTIYEIGSVGKVFTGTLGAWAAAKGEIHLADPVSRYWPALSGTAFDRISFLNLGTYTAGGLPLQFPETVVGEKATLAYFQQWQPSAEPGTERQYSNPSIGLFGFVAARAGQGSFDAAMTQGLLPALGLHHTYLQVPLEQKRHYAYGVTAADARVRVSSGPLDAEAYGIKTTAGDLIRFVQLAMDPSSLDAPLRQAVAATQTGYFQVGPMLQGLGWEIYEEPVQLDTVLTGTVPAMALEPQPGTAFYQPHLSPTRFVHKTGSTRGFGAYAAFRPAEHLGIVLLANRNYPNAERVKAAWEILELLR